MNTLIVGAGAVGLGIGSCIARSTDWPLTFLTRPGGAGELNREGISQSGIFGSHQVRPERFSAVETLENAADLGFDQVLICTKTYDSENAAQAIFTGRPTLSPNVRVVLFHNGWGSSDIFAKYLPCRQLFNARVITGFRRLMPSAVEVTVHADAIRLGSIYYPEQAAELESLAAAISAGGTPAQVSTDVLRYLWSKMVYNCALNPLGAVLNATYGDLGDSAESRFVMDRVIEEAFLVMAAYGYTAHWPNAAGFKLAFYSTMVPRTYAHESSMLQDIKAGKKTEIDFLNGALTRMAEAKSIAAPYNQMLYRQLRFLDQAEPGSFDRGEAFG